MRFDRTGIAATEKIAPQHVFEKFRSRRCHIANMKRALHDGIAQLRRQDDEQSGCEVGWQLRHDIGDDLRMLVGQIGLQVINRQTPKLHPDRFLNELRLNAVFQNCIDFFLRQSFPQETFKPLGGF